MQQTFPTSPLRLSIVYGIAIAVISVVFAMIFYMTKWFADLWTGYAVNLVIFLGVLFCVINANKVLGGRASLGNLFTAGIIAAIVATLIVSATTIIFHLATEPAASSVDIPSDGAEISEYSFNKREGFWIFMMTNVLFANLTLGALGALIGAVTVKRDQKTTRG